MVNQIWRLFALALGNFRNFHRSARFLRWRRINSSSWGCVFLSHGRGIIWRSLFDDRPQMTNAVMDYYFRKGYIKLTKVSVELMIGKMKNWHYTLVVTNNNVFSRAWIWEKSRAL